MNPGGDGDAEQTERPAYKRTAASWPWLMAIAAVAIVTVGLFGFGLDSAAEPAEPFDQRARPLDRGQELSWIDSPSPALAVLFPADFVKQTLQVQACVGTISEFGPPSSPVYNAIHLHRTDEAPEIVVLWAAGSRRAMCERGRGASGGGASRTDELPNEDRPVVVTGGSSSETALGEVDFFSIEGRLDVSVESIKIVAPKPAFQEFRREGDWFRIDGGALPPGVDTFAVSLEIVMIDGTKISGVPQELATVPGRDVCVSNRRCVLEAIDVVRQEAGAAGSSAQESVLATAVLEQDDYNNAIADFAICVEAGGFTNVAGGHTAIPTTIEELGILEQCYDENLVFLDRARSLQNAHARTNGDWPRLRDRE